MNDIRLSPTIRSGSGTLGGEIGGGEIGFNGGMIDDDLRFM